VSDSFVEIMCLWLSILSSVFAVLYICVFLSLGAANRHIDKVVGNWE
jgi:hypothetical protein